MSRLLFFSCSCSDIGHFSIKVNYNAAFFLFSGRIQICKKQVDQRCTLNRDDDVQSHLPECLRWCEIKENIYHFVCTFEAELCVFSLTDGDF